MISQHYNIEQTGSVVLAQIQQEQLDVSVLAELIDDLQQKLRCENAVHVVFDMAGVQFLSSACLGALVQFLQEVQHVRGRIALANCQPNVAFLFKVTRLDSIFQLFDDAEEAVTGVAHG